MLECACSCPTSPGTRGPGTAGSQTWSPWWTTSFPATVTVRGTDLWWGVKSIALKMGQNRAKKGQNRAKKGQKELKKGPKRVKKGPKKGPKKHPKKAEMIIN